MILSTLIIIVISVIICNFVQCFITLKKSKLPSLTMIPILGHTHHFFGTTDVFFEKLMRITSKFKSIGLFIGPFFVPLLYDQKTVSYLINSENRLQRKATQYKFLRNIGNRMIFLTTGTEYKESKRVLVEAVSHANLKGYVKSFNRNADNLASSLEIHLGKEEFNLEPELNFCVISVLLETIMGLEASAMTKEEIMLFSKEFSKSLKYMVCRGYTIWLYPDILFKMSNLYTLSTKSKNHIREVIQRLILTRKTKCETSKQQEGNAEKHSRSSVFIDKFFSSRRENGDEFTIEDITDYVVALIGAGFETTVSSIGFITMLLAINQDVQQKVYMEIEAKMRENDGELTAKALNELPYLDQVIHETWRLYTPVSVLGRKVTEEIELPNGGRFEKGTDVWLGLMMIHRNPDIFPNPHKFNPDHFSAERVKSRPQGTFMPFGFGARKCFGNIFAKLVIRTTICHLLGRYKFETTRKEKDFRLAFEITLKNKIGVPVSITSRNKE